MSFRPLGFAAALLQLVLMTGYVILETRYGQGFASGVVGFVMILVFPAVGVAILLRHPRHLVGVLFCVAQIGWAINNPAGSYARAAVLPFTELAVWLYSWPGLLSGALFVLLLLVFPDGRFLSARWRRVGQLGLAGTLLLAACAAIAPGPVDASIGIAAENPFGVRGTLGDAAAAVSGSAFALQIPLFLLGAVAMVRRYRRADEVVREQLKWFASSVVLMAVLAVMALILLSIFPDPAQTPLWAQIAEQLAIFSVSLVPVAAAVAILRYRLYDIDLLIRRSLIYGSVLAVLAVAYVGGVILVGAALRPLTSGSEVSVAASTLLTVALFQPLRSRVQRTVDRRFYRAKYDAERTLDTFSVRLRDEVDLDTVREGLVDAVRATVHPAHASVWLRR